ncbi:hypothetical protein AXF42_Ash019071 [Apostasia shenzhenica]|uniref:Uncharacterized protein n=1 Tax=Apostasia shenzhenica TaxID=1088818 RepID=A0A2I0BBB7_9ASPA|nr:hypothetical protein AXF42_Ash019071 [Apostasia shenzhenica]
MASSRCLLLLLLGLLVFAATAAAEVSLPNNYVLLEPYDDYNEEYIARIANFGYQVYDYAQNPLARGPFLPKLSNKRLIAVGIQFDFGWVRLVRQYCVIIEGDVLTSQLRVMAVARIMFKLNLFSSSTFGDINKRSIKVDEIEYHRI